MSRHQKAGYVLPIVALSHFEKLPRRVPPFLLTHYIKVLCGSLNSDGGRRRKFDFNASLHANKSVSNPHPCYLCGVGSVTLPGDCITHIFTSCECVKDAWDNRNGRCAENANSRIVALTLSMNNIWMKTSK